VFSSCRNAALNHIRDENTKKRTIETFAESQITDEEISDMEDYLDALEKCIARLPERSKQVFLMHKFDDYSQKKISAKLNISVKTIKNQIWKSLQYLRECLGQK
jgi:RNA polymerase sigma-70 factor (ECF subfamily)